MPTTSPTVSTSSRTLERSFTLARRLPFAKINWTDAEEEEEEEERVEKREEAREEEEKKEEEEEEEKEEEQGENYLDINQEQTKTTENMSELMSTNETQEKEKEEKKEEKKEEEKEEDEKKNENEKKILEFHFHVGVPRIEKKAKTSINYLTAAVAKGEEGEEGEGGGGAQQEHPVERQRITLVDLSTGESFQIFFFLI